MTHSSQPSIYNWSWPISTKKCTQFWWTRCTFLKSVVSMSTVVELHETEATAHWEELLQSVSDFIFSKHYGYRSRGLRGVKRSEKLWEIQNYPLPGRPFTHHWVKSKTICHFLRNFDAFLNGFLFYSILAGWSTWQWVFLNFSQNFWSFDTPDTPGCASVVFAENEIWNRLKQFLPVWFYKKSREKQKNKLHRCMKIRMLLQNWFHSIVSSSHYVQRQQMLFIWVLFFVKMACHKYELHYLKC